MELSTYSLKEKLQLAGAVLFVATLPFLREVNQVFMVFFIFTCIISWDTKKFNKQKKNILFFTSVYGVTLLSSLYSTDFASAYSTLEIQSTLLFVPLFFASSYRSASLKNNIIKIAFITGVSVALIYLLTVFIIKMHQLHQPVSGWLQEKYLNHEYSAPILIHASFFSVYISLCLYFLIYFLPLTKSIFVKTVIILLLGLCFISLFMLASRMVLLLTLVCLIIFIPLEVKKLKWSIRLFFGLIIVFLFIFFFSKSNYFQNRFTDGIEKDVKISELATMKKTDSLTDTTIIRNDGARIERWVAAWKLIEKNPWIGYGTGQEKRVLFEKYGEMGLTTTLEQGYDSHNQFIAFTLQSGIFGLLAFIAMMLYGFYLSLKGRNYIYFSFLFVITGICTIDNFLEVNKGIFFFTFFNAFFFLSIAPLIAKETKISNHSEV